MLYEKLRGKTISEALQLELFSIINQIMHGDSAGFYSRSVF